MTDDRRPVLEVEDLSLSYSGGRQAPPVVRGVSLTIARGRTLGLVGESGSGKSTIAKALVGRLKPVAGSIRVDGVDLAHMTGPQRRAMRRTVQLIPQDPYSSLDPRRTVGEALAEAIDPVRGTVGRHRDEIAHWLSLILLEPDTIDRYPHEFSGGQRQRIAVARALAVRPKLIVADEITSALDLSVQAEVLNLIGRLRAELELTMLFISHNLAVVHHVSDEIMVLFHGEVMEFGDVDDVYERPRSDYAKTLLASVPGGPGFDIESA
jgi:ABC-type glutathione transport system ATPase component